MPEEVLRKQGACGWRHIKVVGFGTLGSPMKCA